ncbi:N-acetylmuramoyl-L-alanine amidase [Flavobacterium sp. NRK F10]|uniref:N-acetylmuramoyl-L-alanine amidase n=1 Tax=Flavobacterium sediminis TaxID=2201181 RepID=A0A2U8QYD6_9FLAO|nr:MULTISPECIES: N-acetylmuramoyl-L-alanine amidase [Flavobacterium]AWM14926.1 N-acetylmuramoyl-L-alanine amidase [Flavobacterium sediminis]MCO6176187.1 N-acetylmuramoyl-L-alanine amidase [Flavobacterium sp. NRK F10]
MKRNIGVKVLILMLVTSMFQFTNAQYKNKFKIVLDAGHGGKDPGNSYHGYVEKNIALATTLLVGKYLDKYPDIEILYTRKTDVFIELKDRPKLANENNADLFVSIHCNSVKNLAPFGTETFVMGLNRSSTNLEVAKQENSVILLEKDYKEKYNGFDPNKPETLIGLKILQEEYLDQSIALASIIETKFTKKLKRNSRGVKQSPLWVLDASYMPSVLIELGFLSNKTEGSYLNSTKGKEEMAQAIVDAVLEYKKEYFDSSSSEKSNTVQEANDTVKTTTVSKKGITFKVQIAASGRKLETRSSNFKGLKNISREQSGSLYKYFYGSEDSYDEAQDRLKEAKAKGYSTAFIVAYKDGVKINMSDAIK